MTFSHHCVLVSPMKKMSSEQNLFRASSQGRPSHVYQHMFGKGREGSSFPHQRLVILTLGLLDVVLLIIAVVIGIYCAKAKDYQILDDAALPLLVELRYLRNSSNVLKPQQEAQAALLKEQLDHMELKTKMREKNALNDISQKQIETLLKEKNMLQPNITRYEETCDRCPAGWNLIQSTCYYYSQHEPGLRKNWNDSRAECIKQGGDLLVINSFKEQELLTYNMPRVSRSGTWWSNGLWMGLTEVNGTWVWIDNTTAMNASYWLPGQPKDIGPQSGSCAAFYFLSSIKTWFNENCQDNLLNWICEMEPPL